MSPNNKNPSSQEFKAVPWCSTQVTATLFGRGCLQLSKTSSAFRDANRTSSRESILTYWSGCLPPVSQYLWTPELSRRKAGLFKSSSPREDRGLLSQGLSCCLTAGGNKKFQCPRERAASWRGGVAKAGCLVFWPWLVSQASRRGGKLNHRMNKEGVGSSPLVNRTAMDMV